MGSEIIKEALDKTQDIDLPRERHYNYKKYVLTVLLLNSLNMITSRYRRLRSRDPKSLIPVLVG